MIAKHFDHPAARDFTARALFDHAFKLCLQRRQPGDPDIDIRQMAGGQFIGGEA